MSASIEALAMAGVDYLIHNLDIEEWEEEELELPPPHLLAEEEEEEEEEKVERNSKDSFPICRWMEGNATRSWNADNLLTITMTGTIDIQALTDRFWKRMHKKNVDVKILPWMDEGEKKVGSKSSSKEKPIEKSDPASSEKDDSTKSSSEEKTSKKADPSKDQTPNTKVDTTNSSKDKKAIRKLTLHVLQKIRNLMRKLTLHVLPREPR
ncbi:hypothetical protein Peur_036571 [Populus x canadensis]